MQFHLCWENLQAYNHAVGRVSENRLTGWLSGEKILPHLTQFRSAYNWSVLCAIKVYDHRRNSNSKTKAIANTPD